MTSIGKRILVVDDDEQVLFVLHDTLIRLGGGCQVVTARNGHEALDKFRGMSFDLVITDLKMPDMNGIELTEAIRALDPSVGIIWVTAYGTDEIRAEAARLAVYCCLDKPLEIGEIRRFAREALEWGGGPVARQTV